MLEELASQAFWTGLGQIILINTILSGDNAVVIALAARSLPPPQQKQAILWGSGAAVVVRIILTIAAVALLRLPFLKIVGGMLLLWIAVKLMLPEKEQGTAGGKAGVGLWAAMRSIFIADVVMSLDNVIAVAAAAKGSVTPLILGLAISIPWVIFGSMLLLKVMERYPVIITLGAALLGWVAGGMFVTDPVIEDRVNAGTALLHWATPAAGAVFVVAAGTWLARRRCRACS